MGISTEVSEYRRDPQTRKRITVEYLPSSGRLHAGFSAKVMTLNPGIWQVNFTMSASALPM